MKKLHKAPVICTVFILVLILLIEHSLIWENIEKIGALATALALTAAMYQSYVTWMAAKATSEANSQNFFQQKFNLILEQHNNLLLSVNEWLKENEVISDKPTNILVCYVRGHDVLSPYMIILYHILKNIASDLPDTSQDQVPKIQNKKKYSSLVRSFIPNNLLYLIAINASVTNKYVFSIPGSKEYVQYQQMLIDFDFFEHLILRKQKKIKLSESMQLIANLTYNACLAFCIKNAGINDDLYDENIHITEFDNLLNNIDFYLCIVYNFQNKYIEIPEYAQKTKTIKELIPIYINYYLNLLSQNKLNEYAKIKINKIIEKHIANIISEANFYSEGSGKISGLFNGWVIFDFFCNNIKADKTLCELIRFRDDFHTELSELINIHCYEHECIKHKERDALEAIEHISKHIKDFLTKIIKLKQIINVQFHTSDILMRKKHKLIEHITKKIA